MTPLLSELHAKNELLILCPSAVCPTLDDVEITQILLRHRRAVLWAADTLFHLGAVVVPTLANRTGSRYRAIEYTAAGTDQKTGATEPVWSSTRQSRITDNHIIWEEEGPDYNMVLWDLVGAAREGWLLKASKTVGRVDFTTQSIGVSAGQLHEHCLEMAARFQPVFLL